MTGNWPWRGQSSLAAMHSGSSRSSCRRTCGRHNRRGSLAVKAKLSRMNTTASISIGLLARQAGCSVPTIPVSALFGVAGTSASPSSKFVSWWGLLTSPAGPVLKYVRWPPGTWLKCETSWMSCKRSNEAWPRSSGAATRPAPAVRLSTAPSLKTWHHRATGPRGWLCRHRARKQARAAVELYESLEPTRGAVCEPASWPARESERLNANAAAAFPQCPSRLRRCADFA